MNSLTSFLRKHIEPVLRPVARILGRVGIKPDHLTLLAFFCGLGAVYFFLVDWQWFTILSIAHIVLDLLDGALARATGAGSQRGKKLDWWSDRTIAFLIIGKCIYTYGITPLTPFTGETITGVLALIIGLITSSWFIRSKKNVPVLNARSLILILGILKLSWLIIPIAFAIYLSSLVWQVWYSLNNL